MAVVIVMLVALARSMYFFLGNTVIGFCIVAELPSCRTAMEVMVASVNVLRTP